MINLLAELDNGRIRLMMWGNSLSKCSDALSLKVAIAINPACCSLMLVDCNAYIICGTNNGNKNLTLKSLTILPKQSSATDEISFNYRQLSSNVDSQSFLSTSVNIFIIPITV